MKKDLFRVACCLLTVVLMSLFPAPGLGETPPSSFIPEKLTDWKAWVLHGKEKALCPTSHSDGEQVMCQWPSRLQLFINDHGGRFEQTWLLFAEDWICLPGNPGAWPQGVQAGDGPVPVMDRNDTPAIRLSAGEHRVTGTFVWENMPEMIRVPPAVGLVALYINERKIDIPEMDPEGRLWLQKRKEAVGSEDTLSVRLFRLLNDTIPMQVTTRILLNVSGRPREIRIEAVLMDQSVPVRLDSPLPAKLAADGALLCQVRPGEWDLRLTTRSLGPVDRLVCNGQHGNEIWSFQSQNHLRMVEITGAPAVEPERTDMPTDWKGRPAYALSPGGELILKELRRGDPDPAPDSLTLHRTWWLDFDGAGFTLQDAISGTMSRQWYLAMNSPGELGRVAIDGADQLITRQGKEQRPGVSLRRGNVSLVADSRLEADLRQIPAVGWDHDFQSVSGVLHLPPGWRLIAAGGIDSISGTWIQNWSLLDFFLALIISLSILKLRNWKWGGIALITIILIFHEPGAPRLVWLHLIGALALLKLLPDGWFKKLVTLWGAASVVALLVIALPFMVMQIRWGVYPQLVPVSAAEPSWMQGPKKMTALSDMVPPAPATLPAPAGSEQSGSGANEDSSRKRSPLAFYEQLKSSEAMPGDRKIHQQAVFAADPNALIQTGPGLPTWRWRAFNIGWNGPVERSQTIQLWLVSPVGNLIFGVLRALLLAVLMIGLLMDARSWWPRVKKTFQHPESVAALTLLFLIAGSGKVALAQFPSPELLTELQDRLLEKPDCLPQCASVTRMAISLDADTLSLSMALDAATGTAIPLPATLASWTPERILLDETDLSGLSRDNAGTLWAYIPEGVHEVVLTGRVMGDVLRISLPLAPHVAAVDSRGWTVRGIHPDGSTDATIEMTRTLMQTSLQQGYGNQSLPPFFQVRREFHLGLTWRISTVVKRITPPGTPVMLSYPLLADESVMTPGVQVEDKSVRIAMAPHEDAVAFESSLSPGEKLDLIAPASVPWTETWVMDISPIWQCDFSGIPAIHHQDYESNWQPQWAPWPGESLSIKVSRPEAITGKMMTIDAARLDWTPGLRFNKAGLSVSIRTSRGGQHEILLPEGADLQGVSVDNRSLPIGQEGGRITVPLQPGAQEIQVAWHQPGASPIFIRPPVISVGGEAVNAHIAIHMPQNGWILLAGGPRLGPAVLFWSYLVVVMLAAFGLRWIGVTPLKFHQWLLLGIGLTQVSPLTALVVVGWFPAIGFRKKKTPPDQWLAFNGVQLILVLWTLVALFGLYEAVERGLLGIPDMQIAGNQSTPHLLQWTQDRITSAMPQPWVVSFPLWVYRVLMLLWSLWLAFSLLKWLQWGWHCFSSVQLWKRAAPRKERFKKSASEQGMPPDPVSSPKQEG